MNKYFLTFILPYYLKHTRKELDSSKMCLVSYALVFNSMMSYHCLLTTNLNFDVIRHFLSNCRAVVSNAVRITRDVL